MENVNEEKSIGVLQMELYSCRISIRNHFRYLHSTVNANYSTIDQHQIIEVLDVLDQVFKDVRAVILEVEALKSRAVYLKKVIDLKAKQKPLPETSQPVK